MSHDILLEDTENEDHLYFIRIGYFEYMFGYVYNDKQVSEHVMNLSVALNSNLKQLGMCEKDVTLFEWLRANDYEGIRYDRNIDYL